MTSRASNPSDVDVRRAKLRASRPDPTSRMSASAVCADDEDVARAAPAGVLDSAAARVADRGECVRSACSAAPARARRRTRTRWRRRPRRAGPANRASPDRAGNRRRRRPQQAQAIRPTAISTPSPAPMAARTKASVMTCRIRLERLAPSAARIPISRCLPSARTRNRFATFAHATSSSMRDRAEQNPQRPLELADQVLLHQRNERLVVAVGQERTIGRAVHASP